MVFSVHTDGGLTVVSRVENMWLEGQNKETMIKDFKQV